MNPDKQQPEPFLSIDQALELIPGMTRTHLAQLRYDGTGPVFYKPTPRTVFYRASDIYKWLEAGRRTITADNVEA
ncbi:hypothetical protein H6A14_08390 [Bifidobacterium pullorum subsp. saeculare]|uniref:helix-turn-helix transcriptional regulator n=1 Tax=Bifidobacterium pullorum TaxID=78448 RepID=UPI00195C4B2F|nr:hypothetical protein [Bifidobacterium pullorum]MBM6731177.1 hypothetical protein [Bifidobacterium pullorum subsp. saeculare]